MFKPAADAWAIDVLQHIRKRQTFETNHVELKSQIVDPKKFAPQLAAAANAARWHPVLLLFGAERKAGLTGIEPFEAGDWFQSVRAEFEIGHAPLLAYQTFLMFEEMTFGVFVFDSDNPPYVIGRGKKGGPREVLWRYGSNSTPAGREELLAMLLPRAQDPEVEPLTAELKLTRDRHLQLRMDMFVYPAPSSDALVVPFHRVQVRVASARGSVESLRKSVSMVPPRQPSSLAKLLDSAVAIPGPSKLELVAFSEEDVQVTADDVELSIVCTVHPARFDHPFTFSTSLQRREHPDYLGYWEREEQHDVPLYTAADNVREIKEQLARWAPKTRFPTFL